MSTPSQLATRIALAIINRVANPALHLDGHDCNVQNLSAIIEPLLPDDGAPERARAESRYRVIRELLATLQRRDDQVRQAEPLAAALSAILPSANHMRCSSENFSPDEWLSSTHRRADWERAYEALAAYRGETEIPALVYKREPVCHCGQRIDPEAGTCLCEDCPTCNPSPDPSTIRALAEARQEYFDRMSVGSI